LSALNNNLNISISGYPATGSTSLALLLAIILNKKFIYAGGLYKYIGEQLGYDSKGKDFLEYENKYGEAWDTLWENYISWRLNNSEGFLANTKISFFFTEKKDDLFEIFLIADAESRASRVKNAKRTEDIFLRQKELNARWKELFNIDFSDLDFINSKVNLLLDNSSLSLSSTFEKTLDKLQSSFNNSLYINKDIDIKNLVKLALNNDKKSLYAILDSKNLLLDYKLVFNEWVTYFKKDLDKTKQEWQDVIYSSI